MVCARCAQNSVKFHKVHRDGLDVGPVVRICYRCAALPMNVIWESIAQALDHPHAYKPAHAIRLYVATEVSARV